VFGQTYSPTDLGVIALLVFFEGLLSIDNALVLALLARRLPQPLRAKALTYGLGGAFVFRFIMIASAAFLLQWRIVKLIGGGYLLWISLQHFFFKKEEPPPAFDDAEDAAPRGTPAPGFWATVALIEVTDVAFAVDSILAAIALVGSAPPGHVGPHPKLWVVITGGMIGVMLMRIAAAMFIKLLERFPRFETSAYLLVLVIGLKLLVDWAVNTQQQPNRANFHDPSSPLFWTFWSLMVVCIAIGFLPAKKAKTILAADERG
jgi:YkoY family integral membrane protein